VNVYRADRESYEICENCVAINNSFVDVEIKRCLPRGIDDIKTAEMSVICPCGDVKVYILDETIAHRMGEGVFKDLEEPPALYFFLPPPNSEDPIYDLLSRCQRFDFRRIPEKSLPN
jgi:DNA polymerase-3 subunit gamma/tau